MHKGLLSASLVLALPGEYQLFGSRPLTNVFTTIQFDCAANFSAAVCSQCDCACARQRSPSPGVCLFEWPRLDWSDSVQPRVRRARGQPAGAGDCLRTFHECARRLGDPAVLDPHLFEVERFTYHAADGRACTNIAPNVALNESHPHALEDLLGYSFQFTPSDLIYLSPRGASTRLSLILSAAPFLTTNDRRADYVPVYTRYSIAPIRDQTTVWAGRYSDQESSASPPRTSDEIESYPCFQVPPTLPMRCALKPLPGSDAHTALECNWQKLLRTLEYVQPNERFQVNLSVRFGNVTGRFNEFDAHPKMLPPLRGYELWSYSKAHFTLTGRDMYFRDASEYDFPVCVYEKAATTVYSAAAMADPEWAAVIAGNSWLPVDSVAVCAESGGRMMAEAEFLETFGCAEKEGCGCGSASAGSFARASTRRLNASKAKLVSFSLPLGPLC